jgi:5-methylcytosine-specific restriction endonuclease McrA
MKEKMTEPFYTDVDDDDIKREKAKARELRNSQWWKRRRSAGVCYYCGRTFKPAELTMDHIVPIGRGGKSTKGNVVPACKECNTKKKYMLLIEWEEYLKSVKEEEH